MAKSKETFNKKEKEKQKLKKRQDKLEKKEERKANARDGNNLDDMIAYVDENGNFTSSPPDPKKRVTVSLEDIEIGVRKAEEGDAAETLRTGVITMFNTSKGFGFIRDLQSQESIFVHMSALTVQVKESDKVSFEVERTHKGKSAVNVQKAK